MGVGSQRAGRAYPQAPGQYKKAVLVVSGAGQSSGSWMVRMGTGYSE